MSTNRMRLAVVGTALAIAAPLVGLTTAVADDSRSTRAAETTEAAQARQKRTITIRGVEPKENVFVARGRVQPTYERRRAIMQRKLRSQERWKGWRTFRTNDRSRYRQRIAALKRKGVVCYRVKVKGNHRFKASTSSQVCIRTF